MRLISLFIILVSLPIFLFATGQSTEGTVVPLNSSSNTTQPATCKFGCSGKGQCLPGPRCQCMIGFSGEYCEYSVAKAIPVEFGLTRAFVCISFFIILVLAALTLYFRRKNETEGLLNASKIIMIEIIVLALANILHWAIDPFGFVGNIPFALTRTFFIITFPLLSTVYCTVLFHWAEVYFTIAQRMKKEVALSKINKNYNPNVTLEGVLGSMSLINRIKIPFIVLNVLEWVLMIIRESLLQTKVIGTGPGSTGAWVQYLWLWYFTLVYGIECAGFFFWGPRLVKCMPDALQSKMKRVTRRIQFASLCFFFLWIPVAIIQSLPTGRDPYGFLGGDFCLRFAAIIVCGLVLSIFVKFKKTFPFVYFGQSSSKTSGSESKTGEASKGKSASGHESEDGYNNIELEGSSMGVDIV